MSGYKKAKKFVDNWYKRNPGGKRAKNHIKS